MSKEKIIALCMFAPAILGNVAPYLGSIPPGLRKIAICVISVSFLVYACLLFGPSKLKKLLNTGGLNSHGSNKRIMGQNNWTAVGGSGAKSQGVSAVGGSGNAEVHRGHLFAVGGGAGTSFNMPIEKYSAEGGL